MFLGRYDFDGDPDTLLEAYDRMMASMPAEAIGFQICIRRDGGITIYDTCPSAEVFAEFSSSPQTREAMSGAGLPEPVVTPLGEAHAARASADYLI
jgi:hypothetical protein